MQKKLLTPVGVSWMQDTQTDVCCNRNCRCPKFSFTRRKHHCRFCGKIFCDECSPKIKIPIWVPPVPQPGGSPTPVQTCKHNGELEVRCCNSCHLPRCFQPYNEFEGFTPCGRAVDLLFEFLSDKTKNNLLQSCSMMHRQFHVSDTPYFSTVQERLPSLFDGAKIGKGACGTVYRVEDRQRADTNVAVKLVQKSSVYCYFVWRRLYQEISIIRMNDSEYIARLIDVFQTRTELVIILECGDGGNLRGACELVRKKKYNLEIFVAHVIKNVALGLADLFTRNEVIHRDIKAENIVLSRNFSRVMLIDFGLAERLTGPGQKFVPCGTVGYASPENIVAVVEHKKWFHETGDAMHAGDIFSLGVVAFMLLSGTKPLKGQRFTELHAEVRRGIRCQGPRWADVSSEAKQLIEWMLLTPTHLRATVSDILSHVFITKNAPQFTAFEKLRVEELQQADEEEADEWLFVGAHGITSEWALVDEEDTKEFDRLRTASALPVAQPPSPVTPDAPDL